MTPTLPEDAEAIAGAAEKRERWRLAARAYGKAAVLWEAQGQLKKAARCWYRAAWMCDQAGNAVTARLDLETFLKH